MLVPRSVLFLAAAIVVFWVSISSARCETLLIETERFDHPGGWVNDAQFMDQMGSPFLLAHGMGVPVEDATTTVTFPAAGTYRVWVRTRDWVATWNAPGSPGRFQVLVNGRPLKTTFGTRSAEWHWQDGETVEITESGKPVTLALHDLTGLEGRCDAIVLTTDHDFMPPNRDPEMAAWRRKLLGIPEEPAGAGEHDLVVVGGGIAGTCAALSAARLGLRVALVQDRPVLGGNNSSEVRVWLQGSRNKQPFPRVGDVVAELEQERHAHYGPANTADLYEDDKKLALVRAEKNIDLYLDYRANAVEMAGGRIATVVAQHTSSGRRLRLAGRWFADCTGDGSLGVLAGADHDITLQGHLGRCNLWNVIDTGKPAPFPRCLWALDLSDKPFPGRDKAILGVGPDRRGIEALGGWYWESGFDHDPFAAGEAIRDWNFRAMYGAWDALKNVDGRYETYRLHWSAHISGKRESRRLMGDVVLTKEDVLGAKEYPDGCVPTGWPIDLHLPDPRYEKGFEGDAFIAEAIYDRYPAPYWIPYRCLYSRNVPNLFMAGRDISVTHEALGTVRVMRTGGCMGEVVGMAASLCKRHEADPRAVYRDHLEPLKDLMRRGVGRAPALVTISSPIVLRGDAVTAYRDPAAIYHNGTFHLFFTLVRTEPDGKVYSYTASSKSRDLATWSEPRTFTPRDQNLNFSSPGNVVRFEDRWVLCVQTYPRPNGEKYGNNRARLWILRSDDLEHWSEPELLRVKGEVPFEAMGRMIDPYLLEDKDEAGKWWCFYKQNGVSRSWSTDLKHWTFAGSASAGENVCVLVDRDEYVLFHSPANGIGVKRSKDLKAWRDCGLMVLGQREWAWAREGRLTAGFVLDLRREPSVGKAVMFFHASEKSEEITFDTHCHLGLAWSSDLKNWQWPATAQ